MQDIRAEAAEKVAAEIGEAAFPLIADVSDRASVAAAADTLKERGAPINLLWLNAGVGVGSPVLTGKPNAVEWGFGVNVFGLIWTAQLFAPLMDDATGPRHVGFTASSAALRPPAGDFPLYATTKHCAFAVAEALRGEFAAQDIPSTILCPGTINTDIWDAAQARPERFGGVRRQDPSIAGYWREAQKPDVLWPHVAAKIAAGGGYLVCPTDEGETRAAFEARISEIAASFVEI